MQSKAGYVLLHSWGLLGSRWREVWLVLYTDSLLAWYDCQDMTRGGARGGVRLAHSPDLLAAGQLVVRIPSRPTLPANVGMEQVIAVGRRPGDKVFWFVTRSEKEVEEWMSAMASTLPSPPPQQAPRLQGN